MKISCQDKLLPGATLPEKYLNAVQLGFDSIEINLPADRRLHTVADDIKEAISASGLNPSTVCGGYRGWIGDFDMDDRNTALQDIEDTLEKMPSLGATGFILPAAFGIFSRKLPPFIPPRGEEEDKKILHENLYRLSCVAEKVGVALILEPLNRYEDHMINTLSQAVDIVKEIDSPALQVMIDVFHANIEEKDINESIRKFSRYIRHVHLADSNRLQPGCGHTDFSSILKTLKETGFRHHMALECALSGEAYTALKESLGWLKRLMENLDE